MIYCVVFLYQPLIEDDHDFDKKYDLFTSDDERLIILISLFCLKKFSNSFCSERIIWPNEFFIIIRIFHGG